MKAKILIIAMVLITMTSYAGSFYLDLYAEDNAPSSRDGSFYADYSVTVTLTAAVNAGTLNYSIIGVNGEQTYNYVGLRSSNDSYGTFNTLTTSPLASDTYDVTEDVSGGYATVSANW